MAVEKREAEILWQPGVDRIAASQLHRFQKWCGLRTDRSFNEYADLHTWSVGELGEFWQLFLEFSEIPHSGLIEPVFVGSAIEETRWFTNLRLNFAESILGRGYQGPAILSLREPVNEAEEISFDQLRDLVSRCCAGLAGLGIRSGDRVAGYVANVPEAVICALACAHLGAAWCSASPDFGRPALIDRLAQVKPSLLLASDRYAYGGRWFETAPVLERIKQSVPSIRTLVTVPYDKTAGAVTSGTSDLTWAELLDRCSLQGLDFPQHPFNQALYILFSSGTTGRPKCLVHGAGGTLLQHLKELRLHCDIGPGSRLLFFTTCGWMMWNWQLSALATGATICLYDGSPAHPSVDAIWRQVGRHGVTHFGTSGRYLESCLKAVPPIRFPSGSFESLRTVLYTGSPLSPEGYRWVYRHVERDLHLAGISGGTDIVSCFVLGSPTLPVRAGEIQCKGLGVDVVALDGAGRPILDEPGELVCRQPIPSMPLGFLDDPGGRKYRQAYFDHYLGFWRHGDWVEFRSGGGIVIHGRSDATLNPGGVRIGSAEIYAVLDGIPWIRGAVVAGWKLPGSADEIAVLAVVLQEGLSLGKEQEEEIRRTIRLSCSPRHVPARIFQVSTVPVTRSGKTVELAVRAVLAGDEIANREALANPEVLDEFEVIRERLLEDYSSKK